MDEYIEREALMRRIKEINCAECDSYHGLRCRACWVDDTLDYIASESAVDVEKMSDGYHTFADLYEQRLILSAALAKNNPHAWKSKRHEDGSVPFGGGWFIMGFDTDEGCYTYHYELKDWDLFQCKELDKGKPWDGHTSKDVRRLLSIPAADVEPVRRWIPVTERLPEKNKEVVGWYKDNPFSPFRYGIVSWNGHGWVFTYAQRYVDAVTYWMPLPEPPKEDSQCDT